MSTAEDLSSSCDGPLASHVKKEKRRKHYNTLQRSIIETYETYEKCTRGTPSSLNHADTYQLLASFSLRDSEVLKISKHLKHYNSKSE